jgi:bacteriocin-like protein
MSNLNMNQNFEELDDKELEDIVGGAASFLGGDILAAELSNSSVGELPGGVKGLPNLAAAKSETTLGCWENCTKRISGCRPIKTAE